MKRMTGFVCPMHPEVKSDRPGACPKCGWRWSLPCPLGLRQKLSALHPADRAGPSRQLPDLRDGAGTERRRLSQRRGKRRAARYDAAILDRGSAEPAGVRRRDGSSVSWRPGVGAGRCVALDAIYFKHAGCAVVRMAIFPARLAIAC